MLNPAIQRAFGLFRTVIALAACSYLLLNSALAETAPVGATPGEFAVNQNGGATYTIPLVVPPGTAGMAPKLALSYDRQVQNDLLGVGWNVSGLSTIQRCGATIALDGFDGGVNYNNNDRFCLDGQRLVAIKVNPSDPDPVYGADGTEYRTERESFSKIISYGTAGNGPAYFKVWTKGSQILEFGVTEDARIEAQGKTAVRLWALNKVQDRKGNYLTVTYAEDNANGEYRPTRVDYTGNTAANLSPYNAICFIYDNDPTTTPACNASPTTTRPDIVPRYEGGSIIKVTKRLSHIQTYADATLVRAYRLTYDNNGAVGRSRLISITQCGSDGTCLPGTTLGWSNTGNGLVAPNYSAPALPNLISGGYYSRYIDGALYMREGDFNGDGRTDFMWIPSNGDGRWLIAYGTATGFTIPDYNNPALPSVIPGGYYSRYIDGALYMREGDFNGDGRTDFMWIPSNGDGRWLIAYGTGTGLTIPDYNTPALPNLIPAGYYNRYIDGPVYMQTGDFNGDGKTDYMWIPSNGDGRWLIAYGMGTGLTIPDYNTPALPNLIPGGYYNRYIDGPAYMRTGDFNGDGKTDYLWIPSNGDMRWVIAQANIPAQLSDGLTSITNGLGAQTTITYKPLTDNTVYTKDTNAVYPYQDVQNPTYVVSNYTTSDGIGSNLSYSYAYAGAEVHLQGGGWLGFRRIQVTNNANGVKTTTDYNQVFDGTHRLINYTDVIANNAVVKSTQNFWSPVTFITGKQIFARLDGTLEQTFELNQSPVAGPVTRINTDYVYDSFGNRTSVSTDYNDGNIKTTTNTYTNDAVNWILGLLTRSDITSSTTTTPATSQTRVSTFSYEASTGLQVSTTVEPNGGTGITLTADYIYDGFGNRKTTTLSGVGVESRTTTDLYDARGRFVVSSTNALGQVETKEYDPKWGVLTRLTGPNNLATTWAYDGFGRKINESRADGTTTTITYNSTTQGYSVTTQNSGSAPTIIYHDVLGREIRTETLGFDGTAIYRDTQYDSLGRITQVSRNYFAGQPPQWTRNTYDVLGRVLTSAAPDGSLTSRTYNGLTSTLTNALKQTRTEIKNSRGQIIQVQDALGNSTFFTYDLFGNLAKVTDAVGNVVTMIYDIRGRKTVMQDPDMGSWTYIHNVFGELVSQTDAKGQTTTLTYDKLGRPISRSNAEGTSTWTYDTAIKGVGKLATLTGPGGYQETHTYDLLGRTSRVQTQINGETFNLDTTYDQFGRVEIITYPQTGFRVKQIYNLQGYLSEVRDAVSNGLYWQANGINADGQITDALSGNGLRTERTYPKFCVQGGCVNHYPCSCGVKRSGNRIANWFIAAFHSRALIFHPFVMLRNAR